MDEKLVFKHKVIEHPKDIEYFKQYPTPVMECIQSMHFTNINATIPFFGPMLYFLVRALRCENVLEIGTAEGYTSFYLANAIEDNRIRFQLKNSMFYGIDIVKTDFVKTQLDNLKLPNTILTCDSISIQDNIFTGVKFDLIFQDGCHDVDHILHEFNVLSPKLKGNGKGYWVFHDCYGPGEDGFRALIPILKDHNYEFIRFDDDVYGLAIARKMEGYDYGHKHWKS